MVIHSLDTADNAENFFLKTWKLCKLARLLLTFSSLVIFCMKFSLLSCGLHVGGHWDIGCLQFSDIVFLY